MNETPLEWIAECGESMGHRLGRFASLGAAVALFLFYAMSRQLFALIGLALFAGLFAWMQMHAFLEYEFCYFDGDVDVAAIFNRARRKKKMHFHLDDVEYMVKKIDPQQETKYFCSKRDGGSVYTLITNQEGKRTAIVLEADPAFVKVMEMKRKVR